MSVISYKQDGICSIQFQRVYLNNIHISLKQNKTKHNKTSHLPLKGCVNLFPIRVSFHPFLTGEVFGEGTSLLSLSLSRRACSQRSFPTNVKIYEQPWPRQEWGWPVGGALTPCATWKPPIERTLCLQRSSVAITEALFCGGIPTWLVYSQHQFLASFGLLHMFVATRLSGLCLAVRHQRSYLTLLLLPECKDQRHLKIPCILNGN